MTSRHNSWLSKLYLFLFLNIFISSISIAENTKNIILESTDTSTSTISNDDSASFSLDVDKDILKDKLKDTTNSLNTTETKNVKDSDKLNQIDNKNVKSMATEDTNTIIDSGLAGVGEKNTDNKNPGACKTDKDCKSFPGTVCIEVLMDSVLTDSDFPRKCTPISNESTICRGASAGICPEYQSPSEGFLNPICMFQPASDIMVSSDGLKICNEGDSAADCWIYATVTPQTQVVPVTATSRLLVTSSKNSSISLETKNNVNTPVTAAPVSVLSMTETSSQTRSSSSKESILGRFICADLLGVCPIILDNDKNKINGDTCQPSSCQTGIDELCNNRGTCSPSLLSYDKKKCICYTGYTGVKCEKIDIKNPSGCDIGCGYGGECINKKCICKKYWNGSSRCDKCTSNQACFNNGTCDLNPDSNTNGKCICDEDYTGPTCSGTLHACAGIKCGSKGTCTDGKCYCLSCSPYCVQCKDNSCSECPEMDKSISNTSYTHSYIQVLFFSISILLLNRMHI